MKRALIAVLLAGCGSADPGTVGISAEPVAPPAPVERARVPLTHDIPGPPVEVLEAPPEPAPAGPPANGGCVAGYHDAPSHACCLIDVIPAGQCKCAEYDSTGALVTVGEQCADSCKYNSEGIAEIHTFCVVGGLAADRRL